MEPVPTISKAQIVFDNAVKLILAIAVLGGTGGTFWLLLTGRIPPENKDIALMILTFLIGVSGTVIGFYFGSSSGSAQKTAATLGERK